MKNTVESNSSHSGIPSPSSAEDAGLPVKPKGNKPPVPDENSSIPHLSNRSPTTDPVSAQADAFRTNALPNTLSAPGMTSAPRLVNAQQRHADESESSITPQLPLQSNPHAASSSSHTASATASRVLTSLKEGAHQGDAVTQGSFEWTYGTPASVEQEESQAVAWCRFLANQGNALAQFELGVRYATGEGVEQNASQALALYRLAANQGHADAQYHLGKMYEYGDSIVEQDESQALAWYRLAANQGYADAQYHLGEMYENGDGIVELDESQAIVWYRLAASQGHAAAQWIMGLKYEHGTGVEQDESQAVALYRLSANQGFEYAQYSLGLMYATGKGVEKDESQAFVWFCLAAQQGHADAQNEVVKCYFYGSGVNKNVELATCWRLMFGLKNDRKRIILETPIYKDSMWELLEFVPNVLNKFTEFETVTELVLGRSLWTKDNFANIAELIKANPTLKSLRMKDVSNRNAMMSLLVESLQHNTQLTQLSFDDEYMNDKNRDSGDRVDDAVEAQKTQLLDRNKVIQYLKKHPPVSSDELPFEVLIPLANELIINNLSRGKTREETQAALDEFLLSAQYKTMAASKANTSQSAKF